MLENDNFSINIMKMCVKGIGQWQKNHNISANQTFYSSLELIAPNNRSTRILMTDLMKLSEDSMVPDFILDICDQMKFILDFHAKFDPLHIDTNEEVDQKLSPKEVSFINACSCVDY